MLEHLPDPHPDELLYSMWARFSDHVQYSNKQDVFQELFGYNGGNATVDLPCHLGYFFDNLPTDHSFTLDGLIDCHTLLPYYGPFLSQERYTRLREQMVTGDGRAIHSRAGMVASDVPFPLWLRYCPVCAENDRGEFGERYWHRLHQIPGVEVCPVHKVFLENSTIQARTTLISKEFFSAERAIQSITSRSAECSPFLQALVHIALEALYLLEHRCPSQDSLFFREQYYALFAQHGFLSLGGHVRTIELVDAFKKYYPKELLNLLHCEIPQTRLDASWLSVLTHRANHAQHPLRHILVIHFLGSTVKSLFGRQITYPKPFGDGPWPCLNPVCEHYQQTYIHTYQIDEHNEKHRPLGRFACACGFTYCRSGPDKSHDDALRRDKVLLYGPVWETKLRELWFDQTISLEKIARCLGVVIASVNLQAKKLQLPVPRSSLHSPRSGIVQKRRSTKDTVWYRTQWLALIQEYPEARKSTLRYKSGGVYTWLKRHDEAWLEKYCPPSQMIGKQRRSMFSASQEQEQTSLNKKHMDFDTFMAETVKTVANTLIRDQYRFERVTFRRISRDIPQLARLKRHAEKVPLTMLALQEVLETPEAFAIRRIKAVVQLYQERKYSLNQRGIIEKAKLSRKMLSNPIVIQTVAEAAIILSKYI